MSTDHSNDPFHEQQTAGVEGLKRRLGKYELMRPLGRGGMGEVWLARDMLADVEVALKMLPPELRYSDEAQEQIRTSYQRVYNLGHPYICAVKDLVLDPATGYFLVMDYFDGITLSKYRKQYYSQYAAFPVEEVSRLLTPVAEALDYAHTVGIAHRDVKPGNILVSLDGNQVRVIDFQLASQIRASASLVSQVQVNTSGTYPYMAPELFRGAKATAASDQYALAMTAYELLAGELPFEAAGLEMWKAIVTDPLTSIPEISGLVAHSQAALLQSLSADNKKRLPSCRAFASALAVPLQWQSATTDTVTQHAFQSNVGRNEFASFVAADSRATSSRETPVQKLKRLKAEVGITTEQARELIRNFDYAAAVQILTELTSEQFALCDEELLRDATTRRDRLRELDSQIQSLCESGQFKDPQLLQLLNEYLKLKPNDKEMLTLHAELPQSQALPLAPEAGERFTLRLLIPEPDIPLRTSLSWKAMPPLEKLRLDWKPTPALPCVTLTWVPVPPRTPF